MATLGEAVDISSIIEGASVMAQTTVCSPYELATNSSLSREAYEHLLGIVHSTVPDRVDLAVVGGIFVCARTEGRSDYSVEFSGKREAIVGRPRSLGVVYVEGAFELFGGSVTHVLPAISFDTVDTGLSNGSLELGTAQLYHRVAVPLLGHVIEVYPLVNDQPGK